MPHRPLQSILFSLREATIRFGEGHKEYLADKWQDEDNYIFTLIGIARELNREGIASAKVYLAM